MIPQECGWASLKQGEGGGRRKRNFRSWRAKEDTAQPRPLTQSYDSLL